jgi:hypothetical protein
MLTLAGRRADIVGILTTSVAGGTVEDSPDERCPAAFERKLDWVRDGAGARFPSIELSIIPTVIVTTDRRAEAERIIVSRGWRATTVDDVLAMPSMLIGTVDEIIENLLQRRRRYGLSYVVVSDRMLEAFAPIVRALLGSQE